MQEDEKKNVKALEEKLQKFMRDLSVLKNALLKEQALRKETEEKISDKEVEIRRKTEQIETLEFSNSRLTKRVENLMEEVSKKTESKSSFFNNLLHGKQKDEVEKLQQSIAIVSEDLQVKIEENEKLHKRMYEFRNEQKVKVEGLESKLQEYMQLNNEQAVLLAELRNKKDHLSREVDELESRKRILEKELGDKISQLTSQEITFRTEKMNLNAKVNELSGLIARKIPFNEDKKEELNALNMTRAKKSTAIQSELLQKVLISGDASLQKLDDLAKAYCDKLILISTYAETEDQRTYNEYSKKIRESLPKYTNQWKGFVQDLLELLRLFSTFDVKSFRKNVFELNGRAQDIESKSQNLFAGFPESLNAFESFAKLLKNLFDEEISLVNNFYFLKQKNQIIIKEFTEFSACFGLIYQTAKELKTLNGKENCGETKKKISLWLRIAEHVKRLSKLLESLVRSYKEKLGKEEEGLERSHESEEEESGNLVYIFREQIPLYKFKKINSTLLNTLQSFAIQTSSAFESFAEYLEREFEELAETKKTEYPVNFMGQGYLGQTMMLQSVNDLLKSKPKGIPYQESLDNHKTLNVLREKEVFYNEQISSLKSALHEAETKIDDMKDDQSVYSDVSTVKLYEKDPEQLLTLSKASKIISFLKGKCLENNENIDWTNQEFTIEDINRFINLESLNEKKENGKKVSDTQSNDGKHGLFDTDLDDFSENVAKGLQRISMNYMNKQLKLVPLNKLTQSDECASEKTRLLLDKAREKILEIGLKNERLEQECEDLKLKLEAMKDVMETEKGMREQLEKKYRELERNRLKLNGEMETVKRNYEDQIKMLSEHIISLTSKA